MSPLRVVHVPGRTPYSRKLHSSEVQILNETTVDALMVPRDVTLTWLLDRRPWHWLDVIHLHHPDFEPVSRLRTLLTECRRARKRVVFTAHDVNPVFGDRSTHHRRLRTLAEFDVPFICLTPGAQVEVERRFRARTSLIPHGYVAPPGSVRRPEQRHSGPTRFLIYGSMRPNRDVELVLGVWRFARHLSDTTLHLLLRAPSRTSLTQDVAVWRAISDHAADSRLRVDVLPFPSDTDIHKAVSDADCLVLPYRWASHSGQLEHAMDLGALPVASHIGFLPDQVALHPKTDSPPEWFDWSDGALYDFGARLMNSMHRAHAAIQNGWQSQNLQDFSEFRRHEHAQVLAAHLNLYRS